MKVLKILGIIVLIIVVLIIGFFFLGPSSGHLERQVVINAPAEVIYAEVSNMKVFNKWSPWFKIDPEAEYIWEGPSVGVGAKQIWYSEHPDVGNGYMAISVARPSEFVEMEMGFDENGNKDFTDEGEERPTASFILEEEGENTSVTWTFDISGVSGFEKIRVVGLDWFLGSFYEEGLATLKQRIESRPDFGETIAVEDVDPVTFVGMEVTTPNLPEEIGKMMATTYGQVIEEMSKNEIEIQGYPLAVYTNYEENSISMICGIPVADGVTLDHDSITVLQSYDGMVVKTVHEGDYKLLEGTYEQLDAYISYYGYDIVGAPWEVYVTDPTVEKDTSKWVTEVYYPIK